MMFRVGIKVLWLRLYRPTTTMDMFQMRLNRK